MSKDLAKLSAYELLEQFDAMVRWDHYDPHGRERPSNFDVYELRGEIMRRIDPPAPGEEEDDG